MTPSRLLELADVRRLIEHMANTADNGITHRLLTSACRDLDAAERHELHLARIEKARIERSQLRLFE